MKLQNAVHLTCLVGTFAISSFAYGGDKPKSIFDDNDSVAAVPSTANPPSQSPSRPPEATSRPAAPSDAALDDALKLVHEVFQSEYADKSAEGRKALADKLLAQARATDDLTERFALLQASGDAAADAGDLDAVDLAVDHIAANYETDGSEARLRDYRKLVETSPSSELASASLTAARKAIGNDELNGAEQFLQLVESPALHRAEPGASKEAVILRADLRGRVKAVREVDAARLKLEADPKDAGALALLGSYLCFEKGDWSAGLPMLAASNDERVAPIALAELAPPADATARLEVANQWWALRSLHNGIASAHIAAHAATLYDAAAPGLGGLKHVLAVKRAAEVRANVQQVRLAIDAAKNTVPSTQNAQANNSTSHLSSVAYVCDGSGSMVGLPFDLLRIELKKAIDRLREDQSFNVIFFQEQDAHPLSKTMLAANAVDKSEAYRWMDGMRERGSSDPIKSLRLAFAEKAQLVYLLTDGAFNNNADVVAEIRRLNASKKTRVNTIAFLRPDAPADDRAACESVLREIAEENSGQFKVVLTTDLTR